jgi:hypothetical protein
MTRWRGPLLALAAGGLWSIGGTSATWAHHPIPRPDTGGGWPWPLLWFLGACVFMVVSVATWAAFSIFERRQRAGSSGRESSRRS